MTPVSWAQLLPAGPAISMRDGRSYTFEAGPVIEAFKANNGPLAVDYEHGQEHRAQQGLEAPAAGWIVELQSRAADLWGLVEWTEKAASYVAEGAYRYLSASFSHDGKRITRLQGAGLVNRPGFVLEPLRLEPPEAAIRRQAAELARLAQTYQAEQSALGKHIPIALAVAHVTQTRSTF